MILITGGAWQGKREYAYGLMDTDSDKKLIIEGDRCSLEDMKRVQIVDQLHLWIKRKMEEFMPQRATGGFDGMGQGFDDGWDERVFDQQELLLTQEKIWQELMEVVAENPDVIFIVNELGCGVIPMEMFDRRYRELVGRTCCDLAKEAKEVHRVICGVGTVIKKDVTEAAKASDDKTAGEDAQMPSDADVKPQADADSEDVQTGSNDDGGQAEVSNDGGQADPENTAEEK